MRYLIRTTAWHEERYAWAHELQESLGEDAVLVADHRTEEERKAAPGGYENYLAALELAQDGGAWLIEDDAVLTSRFAEKAAWEVKRHPHVLLQGYSFADADLTRGERWRPPHTFVANVCVYIPEPMACLLYAWAVAWEKPADHRDKRCDPMVRAFLVAHELDYWNIVPNLAQARPSFSVRLGRTYAAAASKTLE